MKGIVHSVDGVSVNPFYRALRYGFRLLPNSVVTPLRDFRYSLVSHGIIQTLRWKADLLTGKYRCSVCGRRVGVFLPLDPSILEELRKHGWKFQGHEAETSNLDSYSCPYCDASDRDRLYALYLMDYFQRMQDRETIKIVDFGPTPSLSGFIRKQIARLTHFFYVTADLQMGHVDDKVDLMDMKIYEDNSVDFFICSHVLEHVDDDRKALAELYRILKHEGRGILVVPIILTIDEIDEDPSITDPAERCRRFGQDDHVRLYSKNGFLSRVSAAGFTVHQLGADHFGKDTFRQHGITQQSVLYIVEKQSTSLGQ
jgi:SAM-dependent methyltransferase